MPLSALIHALDPPPPDTVLRAADCLRYRDYLTVVLLVNREKVFLDNWIYIHTPEVKMGRIQNYKNWSSAMVPDSSKTSLGLEYFLWEDDEEWSWPDERLIELGIRECSQLGLVEPEEVEGGTVVRMKKAYPVYDQYYHDSLKILREYLQNFSNLQTIGRNGLHRYNNQDHSMLTGVYAARNILGAEYDVWAVNTEKEYHEEGKVEETTTGDRLIPTRVVPDEDHSRRVNDEEAFVGQALEEAFAHVDALALGVAVGVVSGFGLFLTTIILLLKGGPVVGPTLSLLGQYLVGYEVTWPGAFIGLIEAGLVGFVLGSSIAWLRNTGMSAYAFSLRRHLEVEENPDLLDRV
jgi:hypothetical protein